MSHPQDEAHALSLTTPSTFWSHQADYLHWHKKPKTILSHTTKSLPSSGEKHGHWEWFPDGEISTCFNCVDRHVMAGHGDFDAVIYDSPVTGVKTRYSYAELLEEVETFAGVLREEGVAKGDLVLIYMPMIPASIIGILSTNRLGAIHAVVFGGFAASALAQRIDDSRPTVILTASCGIEGNKPPSPYRDFIEQAIAQSTHKPAKVIVWQRKELPWTPLLVNRGERDWEALVRGAKNRGVKAECVPVGSTEPIYIIYTSGTTGAPKGVLRDSGGHAVGLHLSISYMFGIHGPGDVVLAASDLGWVVGHSYILYGPLLTGAATVLYEGKPVGTPDPSAFWRMVEEYKVDVMFTAPTALRAIRREDPEMKYLKRIGERGGLRTLKALFLAGERSEPAIVELYQQLLGRYGVGGDAGAGAMGKGGKGKEERMKVVDNWWSSETGSPITGIALTPLAGTNRGSTREEREKWYDQNLDHDATTTTAGGSGALVAAAKPGSAGKAMPGFDIRVVDDAGKEVGRGEMGNIVLGLPLAPTAFRTLWEDEERFYKGYLKRFGGKWVDTGDAGWIDGEGYVHVMSRADDILNVSAHRLSTGSIEQAITSHPLVSEACVVGIPDPLKGHLPFAFVALAALSSSEEPSDPVLLKDLNSRIRSQIGPIATLGGLISGRGIIPKTRSGKILRRTLRELLEKAARGELLEATEVSVPATVEDASTVDKAKEKVREYWEKEGGRHGVVEGEVKAKL